MVHAFSYEYKFEDGRLAGLAEYHPDQDYMHYTSSRSTSISRSRNQSSRGSRDDVQVRFAEDSRPSFSSQDSRALLPSPPPSPRKGDALKRALSLHTLKRRASSDVKRTPPPSPYSRPEIERLAASFGPSGPQNISYPIQAALEPKPQHMFEHMFESPRSAPLPPKQARLEVPARPEPFRVMRPNGFGPLLRNDSSHDAALPPRRHPAPQVAHEQDHVAVVDATQPNHGLGISTTPPPESAPLRRKTSKFIEHIEVKEKRSPGSRHEKKSEEIPPVPTIVFAPSSFEAPITKPTVRARTPEDAQPQPERSVKKSPTVRFATDESPDLQGAIFQPKADTRSVVLKENPFFPKQQNSVQQPSTQLKRASTVKAQSAVQGTLPKRSASTRTRPAPLAESVCMAQVKPVLPSPIIAQGYARMISC